MESKNKLSRNYRREAIRLAEAEEKRIAEEAERKKREAEEAKRKAEEDAKRKAEEAKKKAEAAKKRKAAAKKKLAKKQSPRIKLTHVLVLRSAPCSAIAWGFSYLKLVTWNGGHICHYQL